MNGSRSFAVGGRAAGALRPHCDLEHPALELVRMTELAISGGHRVSPRLVRWTVKIAASVMHTSREVLGAL
jgi:hypothetical protein